MRLSRLDYKLSTGPQLKGERDAAKKKMMMMRHKYLLPFVMFFMCLTISITCCQLEGERQGESARQIRRMPERVRVTHVAQSE